MLRRTAALPRSALRAAAQRGYVKSAASLKPVLELDVKKVGSEIRKRGLTNAVSSTRDGGMDRVSWIGGDMPGVGLRVG